MEELTDLVRIPTDCKYWYETTQVCGLRRFVLGFPLEIQAALRPQLAEEGGWSHRDDFVGLAPALGLPIVTRQAEIGDLDLVCVPTCDERQY